MHASLMAHGFTAQAVHQLNGGHNNFQSTWLLTVTENIATSCSAMREHTLFFFIMEYLHGKDNVGHLFS